MKSMGSKCFAQLLDDETNKGYRIDNSLKGKAKQTRRNVK